MDWNTVERMLYFIGLLMAICLLIIITLFFPKVSQTFVNSLFLIVGIMVRELGNVISVIKERINSN